MAKHTRIVNRKLYVLTFLAFIFYAIMTVAVAYYTYDNYAKYGIYYMTETTTIFVSDLFMNSAIVVMMLVTAVLFFVCARQNTIRVQYNPKKEGSSSYGIEFLNGRPEQWNVSANLESQTLEVTLEASMVSISKETIDNLFMGKVVKKN